MRILGAGAAVALLLCLAPAFAAAPAVKDDDKKEAKDDKKVDKVDKVEKKDDKKPKKELKSYEIPYKFTSANHIIVRAKINGKGPFNFVLDTGAPALYVAVPIAKKARVKGDEDGWGDLDKFELEGGLVIPKTRCRVETPFQLTGMNGLGMAGLEIHGLMGYNILAKYRMTFDFTTDKLVFTELDYTPEQPFSMRGKAGGGFGGLEMMGQVMKIIGMLMKRKPAGDVTLRGFYGLTLADGDGSPVVASVLAKGPAGEAGLKKDDAITKVNDREVKNVADVLGVTAKTPGKTDVKLTVKRGDKFEDVTIKTNEGI
jgi:hypothetical protein